MHIIMILSAMAFSWLHAQVQEKPNFLKAVEHHTLMHIPWEEEDWPQESLRDFLERGMRYQKAPQLFRQRHIPFKILTTALPSLTSHNVVDRVTWTDLCLLSGAYDASGCLVEKIHRTKTMMGRAWFSCMLVNPTTEIQELKKRQKIIQELLNNPALYSELQEALDQCKQHEALLFSFWAQDGFLNASGRHYFKVPGLPGLTDWLNTSETALALYSLAEHQARFATAVTVAAGAIVLPVYVAYRVLGHNPPQLLADGADSLRRGGTFGRILGLALSYRMLSSFISERSNHTLNHAVTMGTMASDGVFNALGIRHNFAWAADCIFLERCLQEKMMAVARYIEAMKKIDVLVQSNAILATMDTAAAHEKLYTVDAPNNELLAQLLDMLTTETFAGEPSVFSHQGRVLASFKLMHEQKNNLVSALVAVAEVDSYVAVATLMKEHEAKPVHYCFADFVENMPAPSISLHDFWNPFIAPEKAVANSITLNGNTGAANVILTGPNAGGKSTILKAMAVNLMLTQSFGIVAARSCTITPFAHIATYLNITDDLVAGNSLFKAEVLRAHDLIEKLKNLQPHQYSFVAIDEMFSGTSPEEGRAAAYSVAKHLGSFRQSIAMIATHFPQLTRLAKDTGQFSNYKVSVAFNQGSIRYPFKLEPGISDQHVAIDILESEGFHTSILQDARELIRSDQPTI